MSAFHFGVTTSRLTVPEMRTCQRVAERHGANFVYVGVRGVPGNPLTGWFTATGLGSPFDDARARAVYEDLNQAEVSL